MQIELKLRKADLSKDLKQINSWIKDWNMTALPEWFYPEDVFIIDGVITASYYKTNSKVAYIEQIVSNKHCPDDIRKEGILLIGRHIFKKAKEDGFNIVLGWSRNKSIIKAGEEDGMYTTKHEYACIAKDLRGL